jgi:Chondroitinase B
MASTTTDDPVVAGPRKITIQQIEQEIKKSPLQVLTSPKSFEGKSGIVIEGFDFRKLNKSGEKQCSVTNCQNVTIRRCIFGNKTTLGQGLNIVGARTKNITVEYCIFEKMTFTEDNGGEPLRFGVSNQSGINFDSTVKFCIFRGLSSDPEAISIKSCGNTVEDSFFVDNRSNVTVRHGGKNTIRHNLFTGRGGIRIHGYGNRAVWNCFDDNQEEDSFSPVVLRYGNAEKDPNWTDFKTPSQREGSSHAIYARTLNTEVSNNEFKDCKNTIIELRKGADLSPKVTTNEKNQEVDEFTFEKTVEQPPVPPTPPPTTPPTTPPTPPTPPVEPPADLCDVCGSSDSVEDVTYSFCKKDKLRLEILINALKEFEERQTEAQKIRFASD